MKLDANAVHDAAIGLDNGYWFCRFCRGHAGGMELPRGYGVFHRPECYLVTAGVIRRRNETGISRPGQPERGS